ncbi:MAG: cache domain-containing protein, partial [Patescibacteria group bacterium]
MAQAKSIFFWAFAGFLLPFLIFLFLKNSSWGERFYYNPWVHSFLLLTICGAAFFASKAAYRGYKESEAVNLFLTSLAFYAFGFVFFLHGITVPDFGLFSEALFEVAEHYGLFLGSLILLGLILPLEGLRGFLYRHKSKIFWGWAIALLAAFAALVLFSPLAEALEKAADFFVGLTIPAIVIPLLFLLFSYQRSAGPLIFYFVTALAMLINGAIVPFFYEEWNMLWWYFHFTFFLPFLIILFGLLKHRGQKGEIIRALAKTRSKLMVVFLLVGLLPLGLLGYLNLQSARQDLNQEIADKLSLFAEAKEGQIYAYLDGLESRTLDFASDGFILENMKRINETGSKQTVDDLNHHLIQKKQVLDPSIIGILVVDLKGRVAAATDEDEIGEDESADEYFIEGQKGIFTIEVEEEGGHFDLDNPIAAAAPLIDHQGELLGVLINIFEAGKLHDILSGEFQIKKGAISPKEKKLKTMEIYLVDRHKRILTHPHKLGEAKEHQEDFSTIVVDTLPVRKCLEERKEISAVYTNYDQKEVVGASMCIVQRNWTLVTEITTREAFVPIRQMQQRLIWLALALMVLVIVSALAFSLTITDPLKKLHHGAEIIGRGDFSYRLDIRTGDEIEQLANEFNSMSGKLAVSYQSLEARIKELSKAQSRMASLIESVKLGVVMVDLNLNIILANSSAKNIFGKLPPESLTFKDLEEKLKDVNLSQALSFYVQEGKPVNIKEVKLGDKYFRLFLSAVREITEKQFIGAVMVVEDITEQKFIDRMRTEIASITSHQLRTPLSVIKGNLEMIREGDFGKISGKQKEVLNEIFL